MTLFLEALKQLIPIGIFFISVAIFLFILLKICKRGDNYLTFNGKSLEFNGKNLTIPKKQ